MTIRARAFEQMARAAEAAIKVLGHLRPNGRRPRPEGYWCLRLMGHGDAFRISTHLTEEEKLLLYRLARDVPKQQAIVELGSYVGASSSFLAAGASVSGGRVFCVDSWRNDGMSEGPRDTYAEFTQNVMKYRDRITPLRCTTTEAAVGWTQPVGLLFIDADHSFEGAAADVNAWLPKLAEDAWIVMHDWGWAEGVRSAAEQLVKPVSVGEPIILPNMYAARVGSRGARRGARAEEL